MSRGNELQCPPIRAPYQKIYACTPPLACRYASHVHLLVRGEKLRASKAMADRAADNPRITIHYNTAVRDAEGNGVLSALNLSNIKTGV